MLIFATHQYEFMKQKFENIKFPPEKPWYLHCSPAVLLSTQHQAFATYLLHQYSNTLAIQHRIWQEKIMGYVHVCPCCFIQLHVGEAPQNRRKREVDLRVCQTARCELAF